MDRRDFLASAIVAPVMARIGQSGLPATCMSLYCFWIGELYCCATEEDGHWELFFAYHVDGMTGVELSVPMPPPLREALLNCGLGAELPQFHNGTLSIQSTLAPNEVVQRCERVMATRLG